jgi:hypothetical protein
MFGKLLSTTALTGLVLISASCSEPTRDNQAGTPRNEQTQQVSPPALAEGRTTAAAPNGNRGQLIEEAVAALRETQNALTAIDQNKTDDAIAALERATGKLEIVLARTPDLALAPVDASVTTQDVLGTIKNVENLRDAAEAALDRGQLQDARRLISGLASETVVSVSNLPLATYPAAIKQAAALLHQGKPQEAKTVLETALSTVVVEQTIIPLPIARAQAAIEAAKGLSEKANRSPAENAKLRGLLGNARTELRFGKALGYATEKDMSDLIAAVDEIDRKTSGQQHGTGLLDRVRGLFEQARQASQPQQGKP